MKHRPEILLLYIIIEDRLKQNNPIAIPQLRLHCITEFQKLANKKLVITEDAFEHDITILRSLLLVPVRKSKLTGGYYIPSSAISFLDIHKRNLQEQRHATFVFKFLFGVTPDHSVYYHISTPLYFKEFSKLIPIKQAISERRKLLFKYRLNNGEVVTCEVYPYRLICENLHWHLVANWISRNEVFIFTIRRILPDCEMLEVVPAEELPLDFHLHKEKNDVFSE